LLSSLRASWTALRQEYLSEGRTHLAYSEHLLSKIEPQFTSLRKQLSAEKARLQEAVDHDLKLLRACNDASTKARVKLEQTRNKANTKGNVTPIELQNLADVLTNCLEEETKQKQSAQEAVQELLQHMEV
jgi:hypothetical protein